MGFTQPGCILKRSGREVTHFHLVPRLRMSGTMSPFPMAYTGTTLPFHVSELLESHTSLFNRNFVIACTKCHLQRKNE